MKALLRPIVDKIRTHLTFSTHQRLDKLSMLLGKEFSLRNAHLAANAIPKATSHFSSNATLGGGAGAKPNRI